MRTFSIRRPIRMSLLVSLAGVALIGGGAARGALPQSTQFSDLSGPATDGCRGVDGTMSGTLRSHFVFVETATGAKHFIASEHGKYRVDWNDGSYSLGSIDHSYISLFGRVGETSHTEIYMDKSTVYDAGGNRLGTEFGKDLAHYSIDDRAPLGPSPNDVIHVEFVPDKGGFTCSF